MSIGVWYWYWYWYLVLVLVLVFGIGIGIWYLVLVLVLVFAQTLNRLVLIHPLTPADICYLARASDHWTERTRVMLSLSPYRAPTYDFGKMVKTHVLGTPKLYGIHMVYKWYTNGLKMVTGRSGTL